MAAPSAWRMYSSAKEYMADGTIDLDTHTFKCQLHTSAYTPNLDTHTQRSDLSGEHANQGAPGYETTGKALTTVTWAATTGTAKFDSDDVQWTATGGNITARYAVIYDDNTTTPVDALLVYSLLDTAPADVTATTGNTFTIQMNVSNGIFQMSGATA